ncbi:MAG: UDP-N-acetylmuramoyl-tripeptide--D-alanyl-D-alanine ligase [Eggerthellaceae bacterium]|nr:UDP-N-acetylmuramoyl-tripeptide--D-alanyl-D-alanine ligase [Eggerthellaceae bacterium]
MAWDSRCVSDGCLFVALPGERVDGHDFCADAAREGARVILVERALEPSVQQGLDRAGCATVLVGDTTAALTALAGYWRGLLRGTVLSLTGSSGKTTTKNLVAAVLSSAGTTVATKANQNNELGVPATLLAADQDTDYIVVEMGMRGLGQLAQLCEFARPDAALVTNVGTSHLELLGSRDAIARAKAEPFTFLDPERGVAFVNVSDSFARELVAYGELAQRGVETVFFDGSGADPATYDPALAPSVFASDISFDAEGNPHFTINVPGSSAPCALRLAGIHNVHNSLAAAAVGHFAGLDAVQIAAALETCEAAAGRQLVVTSPAGVRVVDDSYNANPDSMCASLATFRSMEVEGRRVAVLGDMYELGSFTEEGHALAGREAAGSGLDRIVCVGDLARGIADAAVSCGMDARAIDCVSSAQEALSLLAGELAAGDAVLVKASHSVGLDAVVEGLVS